jgi:hypothetical protein
MGDEEAKEGVKEMRVGDKIDSDHHPLKVRMKGRAEKRERSGGKRQSRGVWSLEGREIFRQRVGRVNEVGKGDLGKEWEEMGERIRGALKETEREIGMGGKDKRGWWDDECVGLKKKVRRNLRE